MLVLNWNKYRLIHDVISQQNRNHLKATYFPPKKTKGQAFEENNDAEVNSEKQSSRDTRCCNLMLFNNIRQTHNYAEIKITRDD